MAEVIALVARPFWETLLMVFSSTAIAGLLGGSLGLGLHYMANDRLSGHAAQLAIVKKVADRLINTLRSFPFIILMVLVLPLSRLIVGTSLGTVAAIVPLSVAASPFVARIVEASLSEIDPGVLDAAISSGASKRRILFAILIPEALPSLVSGLTLTMITLVGYSAMAGVIGGGGLGDLAIRYGYQRFRTDIMISAVLVIIALVEGIQLCGNAITRGIRARR
ncbi:MAG: ABC transporter permease [Spirochaetia bacterium]|jgi:D-methionine transport system permease protein|uniref:DL-methionine transporter subunit membrane component protein of ABC superfamily n=2 Tax=root TaxID=1 RepID=A0A652ZTK3_9SPIR|nr:ABC transporter permease [Spirochaetia bacterium]NLX44624.1 ABC transporter permease [Treponema sp.]VBB39102.1 DL-methionine transporter subunit; membrane component protein of ABC superfamily [uncultured Spirochaetota bacterium]HAP54726.1 methionine ABC transporter permease [Spirochaetaceae bacterium]HOI22448.1 methionine ABC transporter permease [Spirochaetales bacterium]